MRNLRSLCLLSCFMLAFASGLRSQQNNVWYFGTSAGISFNPLGSTPLPRPLTDGVMNTNEGCASICDGNGALLFYTNGQTVYNKNHQVMAGGTGLLGHPSAFQSAVVVQLPSNPSHYYIFTADAYENLCAAGYNVSEVDMSQNGGLGAVIMQNKPLSAPGTERLTAARHANGTDVWVITNDLNSNVFRVWLVSCTGLSAAPVVSTVGEIMDTDDMQRIGAFKVSPDGKHLCQTHFPQVDNQTAENFAQLFDFDNATGIISNPKLINYPGSQFNACEFSPDSKLLYITGTRMSYVAQFDCTQPTAAAVIASKTNIPASKGFYGIQMGADGKIYMTKSSQALTAINNPNTRGIGCNLQMDKIPLGRNANLNLPAFLNDLTYNPDTHIDAIVLDSCTGKIQFKAPVIFAPGSTFNWDFGDATSSVLTDPIHTFVPPDNAYTIKLTIQPAGGCGPIEKQMQLVPSGKKATADFSYVVVCDSGYVRFTSLNTLEPDTLIQDRIWDFGDGNTSTNTNPIHYYTTAGTYNVTLTNLTGTACLNRQKTRPVTFEQLTISATPPLSSINEGESVQLNVTGAGVKFQWSPATWLSNPNIANPVAKPRLDTSYVVTVTNASGCKATDTVVIKVKPIPGIYVPNGFTPNDDGLNDIFKPTVGEFYTLLEFSVYNRWGQQLFTTKEKGKGWDGKIGGTVQSNGVFVWIVRALTPDQKRDDRKGTVVLMR